MSHSHATAAEHSMDDAVPQLPPLVSPAMAAKLAKLGMWDMQGWLCGPMGLRSLSALAALQEDEFLYICYVALAASFTPGHIATLCMLRSEAAVCVASERLQTHLPV